MHKENHLLKRWKLAKLFPNFIVFIIIYIYLLILRYSPDAFLMYSSRSFRKLFISEISIIPSELAIIQVTVHEKDAKKRCDFIARSIVRLAVRSHVEPNCFRIRGGSVCEVES